ncbi:MAG TPA: cytochrome c3 family protein [Planctomycetota bacterium]|nr:cytochrome c3 family protein [Planctomycetota bacterium]
MRLWQKKWFRITVIAALVAIPVAVFAGVEQFHYIHTNPKFCMGCHLMEDAAEKWKHSAHKDVACQTCHRADLFEEARLGYGSYILRLQEVGPHAKVPKEICMECHVSKDPKWKQIASTPGHATHMAKRGLECLQCHVTKVHAFKADTEQCLRCHGAGKVTMGKHDELQCLACHDFLGKRDGGATEIPTAATCRQCHAPEKPKDGGEVAQAPAPVPGGLHAGKAAPVWKGHEDCLGCHKPHGKKLEDPIDCLRCHQKLLDPENKHFKEERLNVGCKECHQPHAGK